MGGLGGLGVRLFLLLLQSNGPAPSERFGGWAVVLLLLLCGLPCQAVGRPVRSGADAPAA